MNEPLSATIDHPISPFSGVYQPWNYFGISFLRGSMFEVTDV